MDRNNKSKGTTDTVKTNSSTTKTTKTDNRSSTTRPASAGQPNNRSAPFKGRGGLRRVGGIGIRSKFPLRRGPGNAGATTSGTPNPTTGTNSTNTRTNTPNTDGSTSSDSNRHPRSSNNRSGGSHRPRYDRSSRSDNKEEDNYVSHILLTRRCTKVVTNGKNMRFYVLSVVGDKKGSIGLGQGKSRTIVGAINKSFSDARKNMITVKRVINIRRKFKATTVILKKNNDDQIIASNAFYNIFTAAGITGVSCKIIASKNVMNAAKCLFECFKESNNASLNTAII